MTDTEIKEAVGIAKETQAHAKKQCEEYGWGQDHPDIKAIDVLVKLAQAYLSVKYPGNNPYTEGSIHSICYKKGQDDYRLFLTKRLEGLEEVLLRPTSSKELNTNFGVINESKARFLANAIRRMFE